MKRSSITELPCRTSTVTKFGDGSVTDDGGWTLGCETEGLDFPVGALIEQWGKGIGYTVRGLAIDGHVFWYRTETEDQAKHEADQAARDVQRRQEFEDTGRAKLDADYSKLPETFQERIDKFRNTNPDFRWEFEGYEMMCCVDALKIASHCSINRIATPDDNTEPTAADNIVAYQKLPWEEQAKAGVESGHSGNSFGFACRLAYLWVTDPGLVVQEHGALTPLVGCETYGCPHEVAP